MSYPVEIRPPVGASADTRPPWGHKSVLRPLKQQAEAHWGAPIAQAVLGCPVFFVDDDPVRDAKAQAALEAAARTVGFTDVHFQFEPIAAALDYEQRVTREQTVLVADIGGGTSDFSLVSVCPAAQLVRGDRFASVAQGLGLHAQRLFAPTRQA